MEDFEPEREPLLESHSDLMGPQRPQSHITESESRRIFSRRLSPDWIVREVPSPDYGIDLELELARKSRVTGTKCLIQLKGTGSIPWNRDKSFSFSGVKPTTSVYWHQCDLPVFLVLVDLAEERAFFTPAKSHIRTEFTKLLNQKPIAYRFRQFRYFDDDRGHFPFLSAFFRERMLNERDAALRELPDFQRRFFEFHAHNFLRETSLLVEGEERPRALLELLLAAESLAHRLDRHLTIFTDERDVFQDWKKTRVYPTAMNERDMTKWLERIDRTLTQLVRRARAIVLNFEKDYWAHQDPTLVERAGALITQSAAENTRAIHMRPTRWS